MQPRVRSFNRHLPYGVVFVPGRLHENMGIPQNTAKLPAAAVIVFLPFVRRINPCDSELSPPVLRFYDNPVPGLNRGDTGLKNGRVRDDRYGGEKYERKKQSESAHGFKP